MGFGGCTRQIFARVSGAQQISSKEDQHASPPKKRASRVHCNSFYWDISSVLAKTACLLTFFAVESPRRVITLIQRRPEPKPFFTCQKWGYRMCACGHHYYDHEDVSETEKLFSEHRQARKHALEMNPQTDKDAVPTTTSPKAARGFFQRKSNHEKDTQDVPKEIKLQGGSVKDLLRQISEQVTTDDGPDQNEPPKAQAKKKTRRRWYWPF